MSSLNGEVIACGQNKGGEIQLRIFGDEFYARYETLDGYTVVYDTDCRRYCYVTLASGHFVSSGVPVGKPVPSGLKRHLKETPEVRNEKFGRRYEQVRPREADSGSSATRTFGPGDGLLEGRRVSMGEIKGLTILVNFDDVTTNIDKEEVEKLFNGNNYTKNGNYCSVKEYFEIVSGGKLNYTNTIVGPVKLKKRRSYYIDNTLVKEALDAAVQQFGINLADFDSRGEGIVDAVNFLYAGDSQFSGSLWPHNSYESLQYGGMRTHFYMLTGLGSYTVDLRIGTICHETGHLLCRFPDLYDYGKRDGDYEQSHGLGRYCLMSSGNQLDDRRTPSPVCGYLRELAGWYDRVLVLNGTRAHAAMHGDYGTILKYKTDVPNEYFLIENRTKMELDSLLPSSGLAVYHCDTLGSNEWQDGTRTRHYQCALLQADGSLDLENYVNPGDSGDLFPEEQGVILSHDTTPSTRQWNGSDSGLVVSDIGEEGEEIGFLIGASEDEKIAYGEAFPNIVIPDKNSDGVTSAIAIAEYGQATAVKVGVKIIHSWIGDLVVSIVAPDGAMVVLHNKTGEDGDDIEKTYTTDQVSALQVLEGRSIQGEWNLMVSDNQSLDVGRLASWKLEIAYASEGDVVEGQAEVGTQIPDNSNVGISSAIAFEPEGSVKTINIGVDIEHPYIGDLEVDLVAPSGHSVRLHDTEGQNQDDIKRIFDLSTTPGLQSMVEQPVQGEWKLVVRDLASLDVGTLKSWALRLTY